MLPWLAMWQKSKDSASKIVFSIDCAVWRCLFMMGLGEHSLAMKSLLEYDLICRPFDLHSLKISTSDYMNLENQTPFTTHQILESWIHVSQELYTRIGDRIDDHYFRKVASDCLLERIWKFLEEIENLHLLMDPGDFSRVKSKLMIKVSSESEPFCFSSPVSSSISTELSVTARFLFDEKYEKKSFLWRTMIRAYINGAHFIEAVKPYLPMCNRGIGPNNYTFPRGAVEILVLSVERTKIKVLVVDSSSPWVTRHALSSAVTKVGLPMLLHNCFKDLGIMAVIGYELGSYTRTREALGEAGCILMYEDNLFVIKPRWKHEAVPHQPPKSDVATAVCIGNSQERLPKRYSDQGKFANQTFNGFDTSLVVLIFIAEIVPKNLPGKLTTVDLAVRVFEKIPRPNVVSRNSIISGLIDLGFPKEVHSMFKRMPNRNVVS
ncbi:hypothetical protein NE237_018174 [Protea cynaroides]|uniref:Hs1pro-1 C-terminal domain-containing protein n=1 Tax=Protea cynaroides TaxID=273540 RepID=A0A9Q0QNP3_9MAGN|nr:hypothetical protein NE237_018174 [Protea cynaroides]